MPAPVTVYRSERYGTFFYVISSLTPSTNYTVTTASPDQNAKVDAIQVLLTGVLNTLTLSGNTSSQVLRPERLLATSPARLPDLRRPLRVNQRPMRSRLSKLAALGNYRSAAERSPAPTHIHLISSRLCPGQAEARRPRAFR
jgi:hypothetical protein